jgi:hypothetical protein
MPLMPPGGGLDAEEAIQRIITKAGAPAGGDFNAQAEKGQLLVDVTNAKLYINTGTKAATVWTLVGGQV